MEKELTLKELQEWDKDFSKRKRVDLSDDKLSQMCVLKLVEEVGEVAKAIYEKDWKGVQGEVCDVIIFALKISNIAENIHNQEEISKVFIKKIKYSEARDFDKETGKFSKPQGYGFK